MVKIDKHITGYKVVTNTTGVEVNVIPEGTAHASEIPTIGIIPITKDTVLARPERLFGATFKIKAPTHYEHGIFITFNHIYEEGVAIPFEILCNTKNVELRGALEVLSYTVTTLFRTRSSINHLLDEYRTIPDIKGGYRGKLKSWEEKPRYYTSIYGEIADVIEHYLGVLEETNKAGEELHPDYIPNTGAFLGTAEAMAMGRFPATTYTKEEPPLPEGSYPPNAIICPSCSAKAMVLMDGCLTCVQCGNSKCG